MKIIINADDLGYDAKRDKLAFSLMESGKVTSSTLMAVAPNFENAVQQAKLLTDVSFGVHLTLTEFRLISDNSIFHNIGIIDNDGNVIADIRKIKIKHFSAVKEAMFNEWKLQIEKTLDYGIKISHLDSHHHIHTVWWIFPIIKRIQKHFNIRQLRSPTRCYLFSDAAKKRPHLRSNLMHFLFRYYYRTKTPDYFTSFEKGLCYLTKNPRFDIDAVVEMMCHPGNPMYESETRLLMADWVDDIKKRYRLINYTKI
jgi:chitin disaccharide deacetylase